MTLLAAALVLCRAVFTYTIVIARGREAPLGLKGLSLLRAWSGHHDGGDESSEDVGELHFEFWRPYRIFVS